MTRKQLKTYLISEATVAGIAAGDISERVDQAINMGLRAFWGVWSWYWKMKEVTFSITATATTYDPPSGFGGLIKIVEQGTSSGGDLSFMAKEEFDRMFPKPAADASGTPVVVTCFQSDGKWKLQFYPRPSGAMDFNLVFEKGSGFAVEEVPDGFADGLVIFCSKFIYKAGSKERRSIHNESMEIVRQLQLQNTAHKKPMNSLVSQGPTDTRLPVWADQNASIL